MAFEKGNKLGAKSKVFDAALRRAIAQSDGECLRRVAETLIREAEKGESWAVKELIDRLDGKPVQAVIGDADDPLVIEFRHFNANS